MADQPATQGQGPSKTELTVVCGDVSFAVYPVLVGHFAGDAISGVEQRLNEALQDQLTRRYRLGVYPSGLGSAFVVRNEADRKPAGVVVGLGDVATFTTGAIRTALIAGLSELALAGPSDNDGSVALVPLGVGKGAVSLHGALAATLSATADVQRRLVDQQFGRFEKVNIIELMEDEAHGIWHELRRLLDNSALGAAFTLTDRIAYRQGWARRVGRRVEADSWRAIQITDAQRPDGSRGLRFTSIGDMARAEGFLTGDTSSAKQPLLKAAVNGPAINRGSIGPGRALFELTWPEALKRDSRSDMPTRLILDEVAAQLPFELMDDRRVDADPDLKPPAVRHGLLRQLIQQSFAADRNRAFGPPTALVIGDPRGGWAAAPAAPAGAPARPEFPQLDGARAEAAAVAEQLDGLGYKVTTLIGDSVTPDAVIENVLRGGWTVIHIAAHGCYEYAFRADRLAPGADPNTLPRHTGVVLGDRMVLDNAILQSMPDAPALAFINCCDLGTIDDADEVAARRANAPEFAASFAAELMALGAHAVIAAGWEIADKPAVAFAQTFYEEMLRSGLGFGESIHLARQAAYEANSINNTWGAYQCYGEPDWRLPAPNQDREAAEATPEAPVYASPAEVVAELQSLASQAGVGAGRVDRRPAVEARLALVRQALEGRNWMGEPGVAEALGFAYEAIGDNAEAIAAFEACLTADAAPSLRLVEQLASLRVKQAALRPAGSEDAEAMAQIRRATEDLQRLNALAGETGERLSLIGGAEKRLALLAAGAARDAALATMATAYERARAVAKARGAADAYYPAFMAANAAILARIRRGAARDESEARLLADLDADLGPPHGEPDYWREATRAGAQLLERLSDGDTGDAGAGAIAAAYAEASRRSGDDHALGATREHLEFLREVLGDSSSAAGAAAWVGSILSLMSTPANDQTATSPRSQG